MSKQQMLATTGRVSMDLAHEAMLKDEALRKELYGGADEMAEYGVMRKAELDRASITDDGERKRVLRESVGHFAHWPQCRGTSCRGGRTECRENCNPLPEMACAEPEDIAEMTAWQRIRQGIFDAFGI